MMTEYKKLLSQRKITMLKNLTGPDYIKSIHGATVLADFGAGVWLKEANEGAKRFARWYIEGNPVGRDPHGEGDFVALRLAHIYCRYNHLLEDDTADAIKEFFLRFDFKSKYTSENHRFVFHTSRYLMSSRLPDDEFGAYGLTGEQLKIYDEKWLFDFLIFHARKSWCEFDSSNYFQPDWECLNCLYSLASDKNLRQLSKMIMDVFLMDMIVDSLNGMYGGAHGRIYTKQAHNHLFDTTYPLYQLYFGKDEKCRQLRTVPEALLSDYCPEEIMLKIANGRTKPYVNLERKHFHYSTYEAPQRPLPQGGESLRKYTWYDPDFIIGCVQCQDEYPKGSKAAWYAHHQQHEWDLSFSTDTRAKLFTHHPGCYGAEGEEHGYWTGDLGCCCGKFFQNKTSVLSLYNIPETEKLKFIHAYVPKDVFDEILEDDNIICVRAGNAYGALIFPNGYIWTKEGEWTGVEVISDGALNAAVCEAANIQEFSSIKEFFDYIHDNTVNFDKENMSLTYQSRRSGTLFLDMNGTRLCNGEQIELDYPTYGSPYMYSRWDDLMLEMKFENESVIYDFQNLEVRNG